jgi:hypothetical protein
LRSSSGDDDVYLIKLGTQGSPPSKPTITGQTSGSVGSNYEYDFVSTDPNGFDIKEYIINWGDGTGDEIITGPFASGSPIKVGHTWNSQGSYTIKAKAKNVNGQTGPEGTLTVSMPRDRLLINNPLIRMLEIIFDIFPNLKYIFRL